MIKYKIPLLVAIHCEFVLIKLWLMNVKYPLSNISLEQGW